MKKFVLLVTALLLVLAACGTSDLSTETPAAATVSPSRTPFPTATIVPPTSIPATPTRVLIEGQTTIRVNVRSGPGTSYDSLGQLEAGESVQVISQDSLKTWYQIIYSPASQGVGWIAAQYVQIASGTEVPLEATSTPTGPTGSVMQRLNVRSGPGVDFDSLGLLEAATVVALTGKNTTASWFQIDYPAGPDGRGWVTAQYVQTDDAGGLPVLDDYGMPVTVSTVATPAGPALTPTSTVGPAVDDGDSRTKPAARVDFSAIGTRQFTYSSQVSAPQGDGEDWVEFTPYASGATEARILLSLSCSGNDTLAVELWKNGSLISDWETLGCGDMEKPVTLVAGQAYQLRLAPATGEGLRLASYVLTVRNEP